MVWRHVQRRTKPKVSNSHYAQLNLLRVHLGTDFSIRGIICGVPVITHISHPPLGSRRDRLHILLSVRCTNDVDYNFRIRVDDGGLLGHGGVILIPNVSTTKTMDHRGR